MARRTNNLSSGFVLNTDKDHLEVHYLDGEKYQCQIDEIIEAGNDEFINIQPTDHDLKIWLAIHPEYDGCKHCLPGYHRK